MPFDPPPAAPFDVAAPPQVRLAGTLELETVGAFLDQLARAGDANPVVVEVMTPGGDADAGRRLALEVALARRRLGRRIVFLGKTAVYSAGVTVMAGFPVADRFLTADCRLLIHCRKLARTVQLDGPLDACEQELREVLAEIETGKALQTEGYRQLIEGSEVTLDEIERRAADNWYLTAEEALARGLIAGVV